MYKIAWAIPLESKSRKCTTAAFRKILELKRKNHKKCGGIDVKK